VCVCVYIYIYIYINTFGNWVVVHLHLELCYSNVIPIIKYILYIG